MLGDNEVGVTGVTGANEFSAVMDSEASEGGSRFSKRYHSYKVENKSEIFLRKTEKYRI